MSSSHDQDQQIRDPIIMVLINRDLEQIKICQEINFYVILEMAKMQEGRFLDMRKEIFMDLRERCFLNQLNSNRLGENLVKRFT